VKPVKFISLFISIAISSLSCQLIIGPDLPVSIKITHINSNMTSNTGVGDDWQNVYWEVNGQKVQNCDDITITSSTWNNLIINTHYEEYDEVYNDVGENIYKESIYNLIKNSGFKFGLDLTSTIYEQRSENPTINEIYAIWIDSFEIEIVYL